VTEVRELIFAKLEALSTLSTKHRNKYAVSMSGKANKALQAVKHSCLLIVVVVVFGCDSSLPADPFSKTVIDKTGTNRLALIYVSVGRGPVPDSEAFDFHSLAWQTKTGTNWSDRIVISRRDFEAGTAQSRWISELESFDSSTGRAIIKVAEGGTTNGSKVECSWREWDVTSNTEIRVIRICKEPFEPFNMSLSYKVREKVINHR
jgi:hypothetical protein